MLLEIVIPSKGRIQKLENCLNSILHSTKDLEPYKDYVVKVYFSLQEEYEYFTRLFGEASQILGINFKLLDFHYRVPDFWGYCLRNMQGQALMYLNDDILVFDNTLKLACTEFERHFPDFDGVMGLSQSNLPEGQALEGAFGIIGEKFADRFPNRNVFCMDYDRFRGDYELWIYSKEIGKFYFDKNVKIEHLHPAHDKSQIDETHHDVRKYLPKDNEIYRKRTSLGYLWGRNFNLLMNSKENNAL